MPMTSLLLSCLIAANPEPVFRDHDRVVFLGDSITVLHTWTRLVELSVRLRHPEWSLTFVNAGVGGNTVEDALERLDVDVLVHQPSVVFVNFGMNDASFPDGSSGAAFEKNMTTLLDRLAKAKVRRVVWLDTTPYDSAPLPVPEQPNSFSELQDDVIRLWLPDPTDPAVIAAFPKPQIISRWVTFWYPAQGNALGLTWSAEYDNPAFKIVPEISLTWRTGAWGGATYTENEG